jgi:opacity protein-like surface antigen
MKLKYLLFASACFALGLYLGTKAHAADMPVKAITMSPPVPACSLLACSGWYIGGNLIGTGSNLDILGGGLSNSVFAGGGAVGVDAGAQLWNGRFFAAFESFADYETVNNVQVTAPGMPTNGNRWMIGAVGKFGVGLSGLFGGVPTAAATPSQSPVPITIPASIANALLSPCVAIGEVWRPWGSGWATGAGADFILSQNWNLDLMYLHVIYGSAVVNPGEVQKTDNLIKTALHYKF